MEHPTPGDFIQQPDRLNDQHGPQKIPQCAGPIDAEFLPPVFQTNSITVALPAWMRSSSIGHSGIMRSIQ